MENPLQFLKKKYNLHATPEVVSAAKRTEMRTGEKVSQNPVEQMQNYLDRFKEIIDRKNPAERDQGMEALKKVLHQKFVIKETNIPEETFLLEQRIAREQGHGDVEITDEFRTEKIRQIINSQEQSLDKWVDYLASPDATYPDWAKYWAFRSIVEMGKLEKKEDEEGKESARFKKRTSETTASFPTLNPRALAMTIGILRSSIEEKQKAKNERNPIKNESIKLDDKQFQELLATENFSKIYSQFLIEMPEYSTEGLQEIRGEWVRYPQGSDARKLVQSLDGYPLEWCTADYDTAKSQLQGGDFDVYYSRNESGEAVIPRVAIRMQNGSIAEVRGIAADQNMDPYIAPVVEDKMKEFPDGKSYEKKSQDMKMLTTVENKSKLGQKLNKEELVFIYEINGDIQGFGYERDPRIAEVRELRNPVEDAPIVFECSPDQIATSVQGITENTKVYIGPLEKGIFAKLPSTVEHVYTKFPDNKIRYAQLDASVEYPKDAKGWADAFEKQDIKLEDQNINKMLEKMEATNLSEDQKFVILKVADLGFDQSTRYDALCEKAESLGLELCSQDDGPKLILSMDQQNGTYVRTAMKSIDLGDGPLRLWLVRRFGVGERWLSWNLGDAVRGVRTAPSRFGFASLRT